MAALEWHEEHYLDLLKRQGDPLQRIDALEALLEEQYVECYMTEYGALCCLQGQEKRGRRMIKKQLLLFPGGNYEELAQELLDDGPDAARSVLDELERQRPACAAGERSGPVEPASAPMTPTAEQEVPSPAVPDGCAGLPDPVSRCFDKIVGMEGARKVLADFYTSVQYQTTRSGYNLKVQTRYHFLVRGGIGAGKSLLSERIAALLCEMGASSAPEPHVIEGYRLPELLGTNGDGLTETLDGCEGRTVVIDGLSDLLQGGGNLPVLFRAVLERYSEKSNFILNGRSEELDRLLNLEPSLSGWFLYDISIPAYSLEELAEMAGVIAKRRGYILSAAARGALLERMENEHRSPLFQAGKTVEAIISRASLKLAERVGKMDTASKGILMRIEPEDLGEPEDAPSIEELMAQLDNLTGLAEVKEQVRKLTALAQVDQEAIRRGLPTAGFGTLHTVFLGNAGTGKTTVARIIGGLYKALGILPQGDKLVECKRKDLVAEYEGQTAPKVQSKVKEALGGVLFIDEAYSLCREDRDPFGQEAVDTLVAEIENHRADFMVILAGYTGDMDRFLKSNQGLESRFPNRLEFTDYTQEEMEEIFYGMLASSGKQVDDTCRELVRTYIAENCSKRGFGNARGVRNLRDQILSVQSVRLARRLNGGEELTAADFQQITKEDLLTVIDKADETKTLDDYLAQLDALTGLASVKEQVRRKVDTLLGQQKMKELGLSISTDPGTLHMAFLGNAGTGKTTVARIIAGIYNALGLLPDGDVFVECHREELVGEYQGHTAKKVKAVVDQALGGVLFLDEAYALCHGENDTFGREAVDSLIAHMENHRKELMVILAGYSEDMEAFFASNQGFKSRVPTVLTFEDYTIDELCQILCSMIAGRGFTIQEEVLQTARKIIEPRAGEKSFGNARGVRNIADRIIEFHTARVGRETAAGAELPSEEYLSITVEDIMNSSASR